MGIIKQAKNKHKYAAGLVVCLLGGMTSLFPHMMQTSILFGNYNNIGEALVVVEEFPHQPGSGMGGTSFNSTTGSPPTSMNILKSPLDANDYIYSRDNWDSAPIVVEDYKLIFFAIPKVACTVWKKAFRRMMGYKDWERDGLFLHDPNANGLRYLYHYPLEQARDMLSSPAWTKAIWVRDPLERFLSAYLDKAFEGKGSYFLKKCCINTDWACVAKGQASLEGFLDIVEKNCPTNPHWLPMRDRMEEKHWDYLASTMFVGHVAAHRQGQDAKRLLELVGAWETIGASGWGPFGNQSIFGGKSNAIHKTGSSDKMKVYYSNRNSNPTIAERVLKRYQRDYNFLLFELDPPKLF